ncbi:DUF1176 domain-containing protein [Polymorphum gilvum]|uniref:DUF1176 domain-containing protein n=1 Tax=Polymorphum gilvum (strain LMG 25793 / CGMCC 1.9160 / SL003B-26A1) TaxID=991905 RepID=F2J0I8_POLGS|nr:DUF1176 domain-containing protein [Polymorphum gilvum]ADZ69656.1 hypothetical protein SL003B_1227 [Polymorphum gilvum SL003B-26A1]
MLPRRILLGTLALAIAALSAGDATADARDIPKWGVWTGGCGNTGMCSVSAIVRSQSAWIDVRIVRDWPAAATPLLRITANAPIAKSGTIRFAIDGKSVDEIEIAQLREAQTSITPPPGFRPIGGNGLWYPAGPATQAMIAAIRAGATLTVTLPLAGQEVSIDVPAAGLADGLAWLDDRQQRTGTITALVDPGSNVPADAPHGQAILSPDALPPQVRAAWDGNRYCSDIDPTVFASLDAVAAPLGTDRTLYLLPCGAPTAHNAAFVGFEVRDGEDIRPISLARMSDKGPIATDLIYNARWHPGRLEIEALYKGTARGDCGTWNRWQWTGATFALVEEASKPVCDDIVVPLADWPQTWPQTWALPVTPSRQE